MSVALIRKHQSTLYTLIFLQALAAVAGSLYFSTYGDPLANIAVGSLFPADAGFPPCILCWWARILMYPILVISGVGLLKEDKNFVQYVLPLSFAGILLEIYHYSLQKLPIVNIQPCTLHNPCEAMSVNYLGFITIPFLCLVAFVVIFVCSSLVTFAHRKKQS